MPMTMTETTQPFLTAAQMASDDTLDLTLEAGDAKTIPIKRTPPLPAHDGALDFDLGSLGDESPTIALQKAVPPEPALNFGEFSIGGQPLSAEPQTDDSKDPLSRKLELAEEFRQIGDLEGARDLLEEVVAKGSGAVQTKAQGMLDKLA